VARHCRALVRCASRGSEELTTGSATYVRHYDRVIIHRKYELEVAPGVGWCKCQRGRYLTS